MLKLVIFQGSVRNNNYTQHVRKFVEEIVKKHEDWELDVIDPIEWRFVLENEGESACPPELRERVAAADAYLIVSPEYNHGYPGSLKYVLDLNYEAYNRKPVGFVSVSDGRFGGARMIENLLPVLRTLGLFPIRNEVQFIEVDKVVINNEVQDKETWEKRVARLLEDLAWTAKTLKYGREQMS